MSTGLKSAVTSSARQQGRGQNLCKGRLEMAKKVMVVKDGKRVWVDPKQKKGKAGKQQEEKEEAES